MKRFTIFAALVVCMTALSVAPAAQAPAVVEPAFQLPGVQVPAVAPPAVHVQAAPATGSESAIAVAPLKALLEQLKLDAVAARDPEEPGRYVAALHIAGSQLLVISAPYKVPSLMDKKLAEGKYMDAYQDLMAVASHQGHFFVVDMQADGLVRVPREDEAFDSTTIDGATALSFDGKWDAQNLNERAYTARFRSDDARYTRMLKILTSALSRRTT